MPIFAQKPKSTQQLVLARPTASSRAHIAQSPEKKSRIPLQRATVDQAVQRQVETHTEKLKAGLTDTSSPHFGHDFSQFPVYAPATPTIQTKPKVNEPEDSYEQEAERISEQVLQGFEPQLGPAVPSDGVCTEYQTEPPLRQPASLPTKRVQAVDTGTTAAPPIVHEVLRSSGQPLDPETRSFMEPRFGHDFSRVRVHSGPVAEQSAQALNAKAWTTGHHIVFGPGQFQPATSAGQRLLAHELTHVIQQGGNAVALQRQPAAGSRDAERANAVERAQAISCSTDQLEAQWEAEDKLKLKSRRRNEKSYAWEVGGKDGSRIRKAGTLSPELQQEIIVKLRFFQDQAKAAYIRSIQPAMTEYAESEQVVAIVNAPACAPASAKRATENSGIPCDIAQHEFMLLDEADPGNGRCMNIDKDPEYQNLFDRNIARAVGYAVPGTTWDNVEYSSFRVMQVFYHNGKSEYFALDQIGNFVYGRTDVIRDHIYVKRATGLIYPVSQGGMYFNKLLTPRIVSLKNGLRDQSKELKDLYNLLQVAGSFGSILGLYGLGVESFKASISAFRRSGPARLPGRPLPGIGVKSPQTPTGELHGAFTDLGGDKKGFQIHLVDDSTVTETPTSISNVGLSTKNAGGAQTDPVSKTIWVHRSVVDSNGIVRKWGSRLDLKQVIAHELGHGLNKGGPCSLASRRGADLPGLSADQRTGLLDDAVHISRASSMTDERVSIEALRLPKGYLPPKP